MNRRIEMRAGVFAEFQIVPVPGRSAVVVFGDHGLWYIYRLDADYKNLVVNVLNLKQKNETIEQKINLFQKDNSFAEKIAREQCGLARPGEVVYKIKKQEGND